jgi:hypothetical protein
MCGFTRKTVNFNVELVSDAKLGLVVTISLVFLAFCQMS